MVIAGDAMDFTRWIFSIMLRSRPCTSPALFPEGTRALVAQAPLPSSVFATAASVQLRTLPKERGRCGRDGWADDRWAGPAGLAHLELDVDVVQLESLPNAEVEMSACFAWLAIEDDPVVAA